MQSVESTAEVIEDDIKFLRRMLRETRDSLGVLDDLSDADVRRSERTDDPPKWEKDWLRAGRLADQHGCKGEVIRCVTHRENEDSIFDFCRDLRRAVEELKKLLGEMLDPPMCTTSDHCETESDVAEIRLDEVDLKVLGYLKEMSPAPRTQTQICAGVTYSDKTVRKSLRKLRSFDFIAPPTGKQRSNVITFAGKEYLESIVKVD